MAGLTAAGLVTKTAAEILADIEASQKAALGSDLDVSPSGPLGQINGIFAAHVRELWELAAALYSARDPRGATGDALTGTALLTGTERRAAQRATAPLSVVLAAGTTLPAGSVAGHASDATRQFATLSTVANVGAAQAAFAVTGEQVTAGTLPVATTVTAIVTPVAGWVSVATTGPIVPGADAEADPTLRRRRAAELQAAGTAPVDAIRTALSRVPGVTDVQVVENATSATDADGRPPHSVEAIVTGSALGSTLALALFRSKAAGIRAYGLSDYAVGDALGGTRTVGLTSAIDLPAYAAVVVDVDPQNDPGDAAIKAAAVASVTGLLAGQVARRSVITCALLDLDGIRDVLSVALGSTAVTVAASNMAAPARGRLVFDAARVEVSRVLGG